LKTETPDQRVEKNLRCYYCGRLLPEHEIRPEFKKVDGRIRKLPLCPKDWESPDAHQYIKNRKRAHQIALLSLLGPLLIFLIQGPTLVFWIVGICAVIPGISWVVSTIVLKRRAEGEYYIRPEHRPSEQS
jgi:hypothetical protein